MKRKMKTKLMKRRKVDFVNLMILHPPRSPDESHHLTTWYNPLIHPTIVVVEVLHLESHHHPPK